MHAQNMSGCIDWIFIISTVVLTQKVSSCILEAANEDRHTLILKRVQSNVAPNK